MNALARPMAFAAVLALAALVTTTAHAQVDVNASLSRDTIEVGQTVELTVVVTGAVLGIDAPRVPQIDYLSVVSTASSTNIEFVDGGMRRTTVFSYGLRVSREGTYTIPRMDVPVGDETYMTPVLTLRAVSSATTDPRPDRTPAPSEPQDPRFPDEPPTQPVEPPKEIDAVTEVDNRTPWVGEQVTLTLRFLQAHTLRLMGNVEYEPPSAEGFVAEPLPDEPQRSTVIDGVTYEVATRKTSLIAPTPGEYTIGPATIRFRRSFMEGTETLTTDPIAITVRPLPSAGRPADFSGAVGSIQLAMSLATNEVRVGDAASLRLEISGTGDLRQIRPPEVEVEGGDATIYQSGEERQIGPQQSAEGYQIGGRVAFDYLIMPRSAGELRLRPIVVHYFDPKVARYKSAQTSPATITVYPGEAGETLAENAGRELRYIRESGLALRSAAPLTSRPWFWALQALPLIGLALALRERAERIRRERDPRYRRRVEAGRNARASLDTVDLGGAPAEAYHRLDEVLAEYIAARTDGPAAAISPNTACERLAAEGVAEPLAAEARELLQRVRAGAYAPGAAGAPPPAEAVRETRALIGALEEALR